MWQPLRCAKANFMAFTMTPIHVIIQMHSRTSKIFWTQTWYYVTKVDYL